MFTHPENKMPREIKFYEALHEAADQMMEKDPSVYLMGLGVADLKGIFGSTTGLQEKYGKERVFDMPTSENAMTGVAIGSALNGMRPMMTHQRIDFALLAVEQIVNQAAKWHYMFGGKMKVPLVIRLIVGRGWGQGPQHAQSLQSWFAHIPGLKVVMPTTPFDAKGLLIASIEDSNPVIFIEHRWLYNISGIVPKEYYSIPLGEANVMKEGKDVTIVANSYMALEALKAAELLQKRNIHAEIIDVRTIRPLDEQAIIKSVQKTGRLIAVDTSWKMCSFASEVVACVCEKALHALKSPPVRITSPECPSPSSPALAKKFYPRAVDIAACAKKMLGASDEALLEQAAEFIHFDVPDKSFTGPF